VSVAAPGPPRPLGGNLDCDRPLGVAGTWWIGGRRRRLTPWVLVGVPLAVLVAAVGGVLIFVKAKYALGLGLAVFALGLFSADPTLVAIAAIPCTFVVARLAGGGANLSVSDGVLFLGTLAALPLLRLDEDPQLGRIAGWNLFYIVSLALTVALNPTRSDFIQWGDRLFLFVGSVLVGWVVARYGRARQAATAFVVFGMAVATWACIESVKLHFHTVDLPFGQQKNELGDMLSFALLVAQLNPPWIGMPKRLARVASVLCFLGVLASHSRQAMVGIAVVLVVLVLRDPRLRRRSRLLLLGIVPIAVIVYLTAKRELASHNRFNSLHVRFTWYREAFEVWRTAPIFGVGMRWFYTSRYLFHFQPPNAEIEALASTGVVGLLSLVLVFVLALRATWRLPATYSGLAFGALLMRAVQGQFDIFWVTAQADIPWMLVGLALGALTLERLGPVVRRRERPRLHAPGTSTLSDWSDDADVSPREPAGRGRGSLLPGGPG